MMFNFHTHKRARLDKEIYNFRLGKENLGEYKDGVFSVGIHPWDVESVDMDAQLIALNHALEYENCVALGEVGLDKNCGVDFQLQKTCFQKQLAIAAKKNVKVLIIHSLKAYQEIIEAKKADNGAFIWVLHAFNGTQQLIEQLLKHGFYFSLGSILFQPKAKLMSNLQYIPINRLFLETDDEDKDIKIIYQQFASLTQKDIGALESQIQLNMTAVLPTITARNF